MSDTEETENQSLEILRTALTALEDCRRDHLSGGAPYRCEDYPCCGHTDGLPCNWVSPNEHSPFDDAIKYLRRQIEKTEFEQNAKFGSCKECGGDVADDLVDDSGYCFNCVESFRHQTAIDDWHSGYSDYYPDY